VGLNESNLIVVDRLMERVDTERFILEGNKIGIRQVGEDFTRLETKVSPMNKRMSNNVRLLSSNGE
jgi:hypothetical protein